jgi:hypothetical protein
VESNGVAYTICKFEEMHPMMQFSYPVFWLLVLMRRSRNKRNPARYGTFTMHKGEEALGIYLLTPAEVPEEWKAFAYEPSRATSKLVLSALRASNVTSLLNILRDQI